MRASVVAAMLVTTASPLFAQEAGATDAAYELPRGWVASPTPGILGEPSLLAKLAMSTDTAIGGQPSDGFYVDTGNMITGEGWISAGPGYRRTVLDGRGRLDMSAAVSWNLYKSAQVAFEFPHLANDRLSLGGQTRYQDVLQVKYFGLGNGSLQTAESAYRFNNLDAVVFGRLRAGRLLAIDGRVGWIARPDLSAATGPRVSVPNTVDRFTEATAPGVATQPPFLHSDVTVIADTRDHVGHPTAGGLYRATAAAYSDRDGGAYSFQRYEVEASQFIPLWTRKWILALHGWQVWSEASSGAVVPFYLMPALGGKNTLRGYGSYRFHDNDAQIVNVESRWALLTHMDAAVFADAGKVGSQASDLNHHRARTSYGAGVRFHSATATLLRLDAGHSADGWRVFLVLSDSFKRATPSNDRSSAVPFVP